MSINESLESVCTERSTSGTGEDGISWIPGFLLRSVPESDPNIRSGLQELSPYSESARGKPIIYVFFAYPRTDVPLAAIGEIVVSNCNIRN